MLSIKVQIEESTNLIDVIINLAFNQPINQIGVHLSQVLKTGQPDETGQTRQYIEVAQYLEQSFHQICNEDRPGKKGIPFVGVLLRCVVIVQLFNITCALFTLRTQYENSM